MKKRIVSVLAVLALCLTMLPVAVFAVHPLDGYAKGDKVMMDGKEYTYLGDVTETGLAVDEWTVEEYGAAIAKAGEGYVSYYVEDGLVAMTLNNATITAMSEEDFAGYGIQVEFYDAALKGIGKNTIEAADTAISVSGCLTLTGEFQRIAGMNYGIYCGAVYGFGEEEVSVDGGEVMLNANVAEVEGGIHSDSNLFINGTVGDVTNANGAALSANGDLTIGKEAKVGKLIGANYGIYVSCQMDDAGEFPVSLSSVTIHGTVGDIVSMDLIEDEDCVYIHYGILVFGGDLTIDGTVNSIQAGDYGVWVEGGQFQGEENVTAGIQSAVPVTTVEWPSTWAYAEVMDAILWSLVPENLQGQYTQATTRAEYAALATCLYEAVTEGPIELTEAEKAPFTDTQDENVAKMAKVGVVNGMGDGTFAPDAKLTREQAATMLSRLAYAVGEPLAAGSPNFADNGSISDWAFAAVGQVQAAEIMKGVEDNLFAPQRDYTREQSILTMDRLFNLVYWDNEEE